MKARYFIYDKVEMGDDSETYMLNAPRYKDYGSYTHHFDIWSGYETIEEAEKAIDKHGDKYHRYVIVLEYSRE
jgi:hypothetical protein